MDLVGLSTTGLTVDTFAYDAAGSVWNGSSYVTLVAASYAAYRIATAEKGEATGRYYAQLPAGTRTSEMRLRAGTWAASILKSIGDWTADSILARTPEVPTIPTTNLQFFFDADGATTVLNRVTATRDQGGLGNNGTATGAASPLLEPGDDEIRFDPIYGQPSTQRCITMGSAVLSNKRDFTFFGVFKLSQAKCQDVNPNDNFLTLLDFWLTGGPMIWISRFPDQAFGRIMVYDGAVVTVSTIFPMSSRCAIMVALGPTGVEFRCNDSIQFVAGAMTVGTGTGGGVGGRPGSPPIQGFHGSIIAAGAYGVYLGGSATADALMDFLITQYKCPTRKDVQVICAGDSIIAGTSVDTSEAFNVPNQLRLDGNPEYANIAVGGETADNYKNYIGTAIGLYRRNGAKSILTLSIGTNDGAGGANAATIWASIQSCCANSVTAGISDIILTTMLPRTGLETTRTALNALMRANWQTVPRVRFLVDFDLTPLGVAGANTSTALYQADTVHPNRAGKAMFARELSRPVNQIVNGILSQLSAYQPDYAPLLASSYTASQFTVEGNSFSSTDAP